MKNILISIFLLAGVNAFAQDTTKIKNLQLQARLIEYLAPLVVLGPENDSLFQVFIDVRPKFRTQNPPTGTTLVTIDSIPTIELAALYSRTLSASDGMGVSAIMKAQIASARAANSYLERLCANFELYWTQNLAALRLSGRRILTGK